MSAKKRILFLHGLGQGPDSWRAVAERLTGVDAVIPDLGAMLAGRADYLALRGALFAVCDAEKAPLHLCGLSLGGVLALAYAAHRPERVASLVLIGTPYTMPKRLLKLQDLLFAITPRTAFESLGLTKRQMRGLSLSMATLEIPALLPRVRCRTLVVCGGEERPIGQTNYAELRSGSIEVRGQRVRTAPVASLRKAREIAETLKGWIARGEFLLTEPVQPMPAHSTVKGLKADDE